MSESGSVVPQGQREVHSVQVGSDQSRIPLFTLEEDSGSEVETVTKKKSFELPGWSKPFITGAKVTGLVLGFTACAALATLALPAVLIGVELRDSAKGFEKGARIWEDMSLNNAHNLPRAREYAKKADEDDKKAIGLQIGGGLLAAPYLGLKKCGSELWSML